MLSTLALTFTLASLAAAQPPSVILSTTPCPGSNTSPQTFTVTVNTVGVVKISPNPLCGLALTSSSTLPLSSITCHAFKDGAGTQSGSADFTSTKPALISTNPVEIGSVWCRNSQFNGTAPAGLSSATSAGTSSATMGSSTGSGLPSPIAVPTGMGNGTAGGYNGTEFTNGSVGGGVKGLGLGMVVGGVIAVAALVV